MSEFYVDHGAYGLVSNRLGLDAPTTWGVPQEGDGSSKDPSTASSIAEIKINASPTASETISIAGAIITAGATAAANVFVRGATPDATATNIVTLLNSSNATATVSSLVAFAIGNASQLRNIVYARVKPGVTGTVQIMFRVGSAALNYANNSNVAITTAGWGTIPTITQFAGGSGGCWGWFQNTTAIGQGSSITIGAYGAFSTQPCVCAYGSSSAYPLTIFDRVWCRNNGKTITKSITTAILIGRSAAYPLWMTVDSNLVWTGDNPDAQFVFTITLDADYVNSIFYLYSANSELFFEAVKPNGFRIVLGGANQYGGSSKLDFASTSLPTAVTLRNIEFVDTNTYGSVGSVFTRELAEGMLSTISNMLTFDTCRFVRAITRAYVVTNEGIGHGNNSYQCYENVKFNDCEWDFTYYTGAAEPTIGLISFNSTSSSSMKIEINGGRVLSNIPGGWPLLSGSSFTSDISIRVHGLRGVKLPSAIAGIQSISGDPDENRRYITVSLPDADRTFRHENCVGIVDWMPAQGYPTFSATLPNGTPWSIRVRTVSTAGIMKTARSLDMPRIAMQYDDTEVSRNLIVRMWCKASLEFNNSGLRVVFIFTDSTGVIRSVAVGGELFISAADAWANTDLYQNPTYSARKLVFNTGAYAIKSDTEISALITLSGAMSSGVPEEIFFDPEIGVE